MTSNFLTCIHILWALSFGIGFSFTAPHFVRIGCCLWGLRKAMPAEVPKLDFAISPLCSMLEVILRGQAGGGRVRCPSPYNSRNLHHEPQRHSLAIVQPRRARSHKRWSVAMSGEFEGQRDDAT